MGDLAYLHLVRSQVASGRVTVDVSDAAASPGVLAVLTRADVDGDLSHGGPPVIAADIAYPGQVLAAVVGESEYAAADGLELVDVMVEPAGDDIPRPRDPADGPEDLAGAPTAQLHLPRWHLAPLQTSQCVATPSDDGSQALVVTAPVRDADAFALALAGAAGIPSSRVRVETSDDLGRAQNVPDVVLSGHVLALIAADRLARPVRWQESRSESLTTGGAQAGFHGVATFAGEPGATGSALAIRLRADAGAANLLARADAADQADELAALPWYGISEVDVELDEDSSKLPPATTDATRVIGQVLLTEQVIGKLARAGGVPRAAVQAVLAGAGPGVSASLLAAARGTQADRGDARATAAAAAALAPGLAAFASVEIDRGTGEWAPVSISIAIGGAVTPAVRLAVIAGAVDGFGIAAMQQIDFDEQGNCLAATLMDYVMPTSWEAPDVAVVAVTMPADEAGQLPTMSTDLARKLSTAASAGAIRNALSVLVPAVADALVPVTSSTAWSATQSGSRKES